MTVEQRVSELEKQVAKLKSSIKRPQTTVFVDLKAAGQMFALSSSYLRYLCNTGQLQGVAWKRGRKWLVHAKKMEERLCRLT